ncbi:MAG TPA: OsmC family peroxiredoxin, partial [Acetobacteraceae bacterium]|nr:OsmC family peroxiredoxin [Acetobacteraceae bacterium]
MATYTADVNWMLRKGDDFLSGRYSRGHTVSFDGGTVVPASASPHVVGKWAVEAAVDPEEMLVAALCNCHMLSILHLARLAGFTVVAYR